MSSPASTIELESVDKTYHVGETEVRALRDANLTVLEGQFVVILGPSGCGKSTLMNLIGGLDKPTGGRIRIQGRDISKLSEAGLTAYRRESVGFIFQFFNLVSTLTARENVLMAAELVRDPLDTNQMLEAVGLGARGDHFPSELSGGEQQRVAIARALVKGAPIMLCDEPTGELDEETGRTVLDLLHRTTHERNQTVLVVTHNAAIAAIADRIIRLRSGQIVSDETNPTPLEPMEVRW